MNTISKNVRSLKRWLFDNRYFVIGFSVVLLTHLIVCAINGLGIFGDKAYVGGDNQATLFGGVSEFKRKILNGDSIFYTWHSLGGMNFYLFFVTCLTNLPLVILSLFPFKYYNVVCDVIYIIHSLCMYIVMRYYLINRETGFGFRKDSWEYLLFAVPFALIPQLYNMSMAINYITPYCLMPLVALGLERFVVGKGWKLYFISLIFLMNSNVYMGFVGCFFIVLYYFTLDFKNLKCFVVKSVKVLTLSFIAVMISAYFFIPMLCAAQEGYGFSEYKGIGFFVNWFKVLDKAIWGTPFLLAGNSVDSYWECNLYIGIFVLVLALVYFGIGRIPLNVRLRKLFVLIILLLGINGKTCNYIIHLFHYTHGLHNRHVIYMIFFVITLAADAFVALSYKNRKSDKLACMIVLTGLIVLFAVSYRFNSSLVRLVAYIVTIALVLICGYSLLFKKRMSSDMWRRIVLGIVFLEICSNYIVFFNYPFTYTDKDNYMCDNLVDVEKVVNDMGDIGASRCGYNYRSSIRNVGLSLGYNTNSGFSNNGSLGYCKELHNLGVLSGDIVISEGGYNSFLNAIMARRYIFENKGDGDNSIMDSGCGININSKELLEYGNVVAYENTRCINPIVVAKNVDIYNRYSDGNESTSKNVDGFNNALCCAITGVDDVVVKENVKLDISETMKCYAVIEDTTLRVRRDNEVAPNELVESAHVCLSFVAPKDGEYMVSAFENRNVGYHKKGEKINVYIPVEGRDVYNTNAVKTELVIYRVDEKKLEDAYRVLESNQADIYEFESGYIKGSVHADVTSDVFTTIPYDDYWEIMVDGKKVEKKCVGDGFLSFEVSAGECDIELEYCPKGIRVGIVLSILFGLVSVVMIICSMKKEK